MKTLLPVLSALVLCSCGRDAMKGQEERAAIQEARKAIGEEIIAIKARMRQLPPGGELEIEAQALKRAEDKEAELQARFDASLKEH